MRHTSSLLASLALLLAACGDADEAARTPPDVAAMTYAPDAQPYDPGLDADAAVDEALARAAQTDRLVLISMGGNWCPDCRVLSGMMKTGALADYIDDRFEVVRVDVGRPVAEETGGGFAGYERNRAVAERFGQGAFEGVPTLLIVTPEGEVLNANEPSIFRNARDRNPQDLADYLHRYASDA